jgi:hypothetical protein
MQNKAQVLLDEVMAVYVQNEFDRAAIVYTIETRVLENGDLVLCLTYDGCDPYAGNYLFHAGATFFKETLLNLQNIKL